MSNSYVIAYRQRKYPPGTKVKVSGKTGVVDFVDDVGFIFIKFDGEDVVRLTTDVTKIEIIN